MFTSDPTNSVRRLRVAGLAAFVTLSVAASGCGSQAAEGVQARAVRPDTYSYLHDSRISVSAIDHSTDHDSHINDTKPVDDSTNHDSRINKTG